MTELSQDDVVKAYARAWNRLNIEAFLDLLSDTAHYASQWVFEELENKKAISEYFTQKMETIRKAGVKVYAEIGLTTKGDPGRPCVCMFQSDKNEIKAVVLFEVSDGLIQRVDTCMPELYDPKRTAVYPI